MVWCLKCQHGHKPVQVLNKVTGQHESKCPCPGCNAILDESMVPTKEDKIRDYAKKIGFKGEVSFSDPNSVVVGIKEEDKVYEMKGVTTAHLMTDEEVVYPEAEEAPATPVENSPAEVATPNREVAPLSDITAPSVSEGEPTLAKKKGRPKKKK